MPKVPKIWHPTHAIFNGFANTIGLPHALTIVATSKTYSSNNIGMNFITH
jgi:hypothetical protein